MLDSALLILSLAILIPLCSFSFREPLTLAISMNFLSLAIATMAESTSLAFIFLLSYIWVTIIILRSFGSLKPKNFNNLVASCLIISMGGYILINSGSNLYLLIFGFELIMLSSLYLLKLLSKSERSLEALFEMFFWGIIGSFLLISSIILAALVDSGLINLNFNFLLIALMGFSVKVPLWPFTSWLLKAHVEASTEFSIFLSGFLVKFGILGIYSVIAINNNVMISNLFSSLALIGIVDSLIKIVGQVDLKRVVALTTVIEANWMLLCLISPSRFLVEVGYLLIFIHCMTTTIEFYIVEFIYRRYGTRNLNKVSGLYTLYPNLSKVLLLSLLIVIGLPGTTIFTLKLIFFTNLVQYSFTYFMVLLFSFMLAMPIIFIKIFMLLRGGLICNSTNIRFTRDLTSVELLAILPPIVFSLVGGLLIFIIL